MRRLYEQRIGEYFLLGDSGYALEPWLMTPALNAAPNSPEGSYTEWHCRVRNTIERTNGYVKNVFRCLGHDRALHYDPAKASEIINTCCILYNIMHHFRCLPPEEELEIEEEDEDIPLENPMQGVLLRVAEEKRARIIHTNSLIFCFIMSLNNTKYGCIYLCSTWAYEHCSVDGRYFNE